MGKVLPPKGFEPRFTRHWFLIASRAQACVYEGIPGKNLRFVTRFSNPKGRLTELELISDRPGRKFSSARGNLRHGYEPKAYHHELVAVEFARRLGKELEHALQERRFSDLVLMAEPHFLGILNQAFSPRVQEKIVHKIPREWNEGSDRELESYLEKKLA